MKMTILRVRRWNKSHT